MSKIKEYKKEKNLHDQMKSSAYKAMNEGEYKRSDRDKFGLEIGSKWHDHGEDMGYLTGHSGFYGSSGCSYECTPRLANYLRIVINRNMKSLVDEALKLSEIDLEKIRISAENEAKEVLKLTETK